MKKATGILVFFTHAVYIRTLTDLLILSARKVFTNRPPIEKCCPIKSTFSEQVPISQSTLFFHLSSLHIFSVGAYSRHSNSSMIEHKVSFQGAFVMTRRRIEVLCVLLFQKQTQREIVHCLAHHVNPPPQRKQFLWLQVTFRETTTYFHQTKPHHHRIMSSYLELFS